jgi:hypothetical protein
MRESTVNRREVSHRNESDDLADVVLICELIGVEAPVRLKVEDFDAE